MRTVPSIRPLGKRIGAIGGRFMLDRATGARGKEIGLDFGSYYFGGRGGVLGDVDADVVSAAFVFFNADVVRMFWDKARAVMPATDVAAHYVETCRIWGRTHLGAAEGLGRICELAERVARTADPAGLPLFAAWRTVPLADDEPGRAAQLIHVLRELRGGAHGTAVLAAGLRPLEAVITNGGPGTARMLGWAEPYPEPERFAAAAAEAEDITDRLFAQAFEVLAPAELDELMRRVEAIPDP